MGINDNFRRIGTCVSILISVCIALVGIRLDETDINLYSAVQVTVRVVALVGLCYCILLLSFTWFHDPRSIFHKFLIYLGFIIPVWLFILLIFYYPMIDWILFFLETLWNILIVHKLVTIINTSIFTVKSSTVYRHNEIVKFKKEILSKKEIIKKTKVQEVLKDPKEGKPDSLLNKFAEKGIMNQIFLWIGMIGTQLGFIIIFYGIFFEVLILLIFITIHFLKKKHSK